MLKKYSKNAYLFGVNKYGVDPAVNRFLEMIKDE